MCYLIAVIAFLLLCGLFYGSYSISSGLYVKALCRAKTDRKLVALTFDDGPHPERTPEVLDVLKEHGVKAAFFVVGEKADRYPEIVERIVADGHIVGNHTYSHGGRFPLLGVRKMTAELQECDRAIENITGTKPLFFRPPFGVTNPNVAKAVKAGGYKVMGWSIRSLDTMNRPREEVLHRVTRRLHPGAVVLLHDDRQDGGRLLDGILKEVKHKGYDTVRADILFETE